ncbi:MULTISPECIES: cytochrome P450 [Streptomyces]|uniref:Cytochrome P450 n=1 Tax=Streptomyces ramulosus TaxID=47762 RepID=A0ABW1FFV2_9ACTN
MMTENAELRFPFPNAAAPLEPAEEYARLRARRPVVAVTLPTGDRAWLVTRYADVRQIYTDPRFSRAAAVRSGAPRANSVGPDPESIVAQDPPEHTRLRRLVAPAFTARRIEALRAGVEALAHRLVDGMRAAGPPADLVTGLAVPLAGTTISELLGIPPSDRGRFRSWSEVVMSTTAHPPEAIRAAQRQFEEYVSALIADRRRSPGEDLIGVLVAARDQRDRLSEKELVNLAWTLLLTGFETTSSQIVNFVVVLLRHPDRLDRLRDEPARIPGAVEELLRYAPRRIDGGAIRVAREDVELAGVTVRAGEAVIPAIASANRDEERFPHADELDLGRTDTAHLSFGLGAHHCLGAQLARVELQSALGALLRGLTGLRLAVPEREVDWRAGTLVPTPTALPVTWERPAPHHATGAGERDDARATAADRPAARAGERFPETAHPCPAESVTLIAPDTGRPVAPAPDAQGGER